jgi:hypothetical protein
MQAAVTSSSAGLPLMGARQPSGWKLARGCALLSSDTMGHGDLGGELGARLGDGVGVAEVAGGRLLQPPRRDDRLARRAATGSTATRSQTWRSSRPVPATGTITPSPLDSSAQIGRGDESTRGPVDARLRTPSAPVANRTARNRRSRRSHSRGSSTERAPLRPVRAHNAFESGVHDATLRVSPDGDAIRPL